MARSRNEENILNALAYIKRNSYMSTSIIVQEQLGPGLSNEF